MSRLLDCPRGRFFSANVGYLCHDDEQVSLHMRPRTHRTVLDTLAKVDARAVAALPEAALLDALGLAVDFARYWQPPDEEDLLFAHPDAVAALRPIAQAALSSPHAAWWGDPVDVDNQRSVEGFRPERGWAERPLADHRPDDALDRWRHHALEWEARFRQYLAEDPGSNVGGEWWSTPVPSSTPSTTREREGVGALELLLEEDSMGYDRARVRPVRVDGTPRAYEIGGPADWARLVDSYPFPVPASRRSEWYYTTGRYLDWHIPDWVAVAADYDAVHLTVHGYLTTPGIAIPLVERPGATVLAGWDPDATFWLRAGVITIDDDPIEWHRTPTGPWTPARAGTDAID
ncbi:DUF4253 domain-containing protein [Prescottella defluvii]